MSLRIFIIDAEESIRESLKMHLEEQGHEVFTASEPSNCLVYQGHDCTKDYPCGHALFINYHLPKMNGLDFIEMMKDRGCKGMMRNTVLMSGNTSAIDQVKARRLGIKVLQKPVTLGTVGIIVDEIEESIPENETLMTIC